jgi:hypothetical protein
LLLSFHSGLIEVENGSVRNICILRLLFKTYKGPDLAHFMPLNLQASIKFACKWFLSISFTSWAKS